jgi:hypothetical protein
MKLHALALLPALIASPLTAQAPSAHLDPDGHLVYAATSRGDHITDFSYAGYMGGGVALPTVSAAQTLMPSGGDDTAALQSALDRTDARAATEHHTLALVLAPGTFHLGKAVNITASNVVLRGSGIDKTILTLTGAPHLGIHIGASTAASEDEDTATTETPTTASTAATTLVPGVYIPSGTRTLQVASVTGFSPGDTIQIDHPITAAYIAFMGMNLPNRDGKPEHWIGSHIVIERRIASIAGNTLTLDVPLTDSYDPKFGGGESTRVQKITPQHRLSQIGVESLSIICPSVKINLDDPHFDGIQLTGVEDAWLRDLRLEDTINTIRVEATARRITIDHVDILQRIPIQSSAKNFAFSLAGTQTLVMRSSVTGDKVFFVATQAREQGPNVVLYSDFQGDQSIEPHQRWGTGFLIDNVNVHGGAINLINRGTMGSGHGWTMGWGVVWNSTADTLSIQAPPGAINWAIGSSGERVGKPMPISGAGSKGRPSLPEGTFESPNKRVKPDSLYLQQLSDRLGPQAVHNIGY